MKMSKIIPLIIAIEFLFQGILIAEEKLPKDKPGTAVFVMAVEEKNAITVTGKIIKEQTKYLHIDMKIPVISGLKNKLFQKNLNNEIEKEQLGLKKQIEEDAKQTYQCPNNCYSPTFPYELMTNYNIKSNDRIFSLETTTYQFMGGAHGLTTNAYYNIDTENSKRLQLKDYFQPGSEYKKILNEEISKQIKEREQKGDFFFEGEEGFQGVKDDQLFYINKDGDLVIVFGLYEIAPYAAGIIEFIIPKEKIASIRMYQ